MIALLCSVAFAQDYAFPTSTEDQPHWGPTSYRDHGGLTDWACGAFTYAGHSGNDFGAGSWSGMTEGRDITAAAAGLVTYVHDGEYDLCAGDCPYGGFGNQVWIRHADGKETIYAHMTKWSITVSEGDFVPCGQVIGLMGSSGHSTGPHLHFGVLSTAGTWHDPFWGSCSAPPSYWVDQGTYRDMPLVECDEPWPACQPLAASLTCGVQLSARNDDPGSTSTHTFYGCDTDLITTGPELALRVTTDRDEPVTLDLSGLSADLDLYALSADACDGRDCIDVSRNGSTSPEQITFDAVGGRPYTVVVDGFAGSTSDFDLAVSCAGSAPLSLDADGACPGQTTLTVTGAAPGSRVAVFSGSGEGRTTLTGGPCAGRDLPIAEARLRTVVVADARGEAVLSPSLPGAACGLWALAVDETCAPSNVTPLQS